MVSSVSAFISLNSCCLLVMTREPLFLCVTLAKDSSHQRIKQQRRPGSRDLKQDMAGGIRNDSCVPSLPANMPLKRCSASLKFFWKQVICCVLVLQYSSRFGGGFGRVSHHSMITVL